MKKTILLVVLSVFAFASFSQVEKINGKTYLLPDVMKSGGCDPFDGSDSISANCTGCWDFFTDGDTYHGVEVAQLFHADDSLKIIGIAGYIHVSEKALTVNNYLGIADTSFNILEEQVLSDTLISSGNTYPYFELIFDNPITVIGDFYVRTDIARPDYYDYNIDPAKYNWSNIPYYGYYVAWENQIKIPRFWSDERCDRQTIMYGTFECSLNYTSGGVYWRNSLDTTGYGINADTIYKLESQTNSFYMFPLIANDENDTVSSVPSVEVENFTYVFPNPASENVTVQCSFKIKSIEIFNEQGQKISETEPNVYNTTIDVSKYPKGTYILKVSTPSGTATKKIVVQ